MSCYDGAGNEARTRYLHLGKVALYQMSYAREARIILTKTVPVVKPLSEKIKKNLKTGRTAGRKWRHFGVFAAFSRDVSTKSDRKTNESLRASENSPQKCACTGALLWGRSYCGGAFSDSKAACFREAVYAPTKSTPRRWSSGGALP